MKKILSIIIVLIIIAYPAFNGYGLLFSENTAFSTDTDAQILSGLAQGEVANVQKKISELRQQAEISPVDEVLKKLDSGEITYRNLFKDVCICGDSLMNGLEAYDILNRNNLITQVSASLYHLSNNKSKIISMQPKVLILHYGLNMLENSSSQPARFIRFYTELLTGLKQELPDTRIIVSGILPVDTTKARAARFKRIDEYNKALEDMCLVVGVEFLDNSGIIENGSEMYAYDGIHLDGEFYEKHWLRSIVKQKEIF